MVDCLDATLGHPVFLCLGFNRGNPRQMDSISQEMAEPQKYWTKDDFKEHVHKEMNWSRIGVDGITQDGYPISDTDWCGVGGPYRWIFWSRERDDSDHLHSRIKDVLRKVLSFYFQEILFQFWAATKTSDGRTLLTTKDQPFGLTRLSHGLCEYRMICKDYTFYVDGRNGEEELGIAGRVYRNKCPECTPDVEYYSVKENPLREHALRCRVGKSLTFPVIERSSQMCVGVLEIVGQIWFGLFPDRVYATFQSLGFECFDSCEHHEMREKYGSTAHKKAFVEIEGVLEPLQKNYKVPLTLTWVPCGACKTLLPVKDLCMVRDVNNATIRDLLNFSFGIFGSPLRNGRGVVGRVLSSPNLLYCSDVTQFSMAEYPLAHFARDCRLRGCFAIKLQSNYNENDVYVLEIFLPDSNKDEDPLTLLSKILETMKKEFKTFSLAYGEVLGKELFVDITEFQNGEQHHCVQALQVTGSLPSLELLQNGGERILVDSSDHQLNDAEQCVIDVNHQQELGTKKTSGRKHRNTGVSIEIPYDDILRYSNLKRKAAAKSLKVSISTFKRVCRKYDINRWPPRNMDKVRPRQLSHVDHQDEVPQLNSNLPSNQASASIAHTQPHDTVMKNANTVNVKAKYVEGVMVLFPLSLASTLEELYECIETRLPLSRATYHACYIDGDNDKITITFDQDLQFWLRHSPRLPGSNAVVLYIDPISQVYHTLVSYTDCFPTSLRPYIQRVKDVASDGNCGFRAIAGLMNIGEDGWVQVRRDLLTELNLHVDDYKIMYGGEQRINELTNCLSWFNGCPGMDRWMTMPDMGHLIASRYNVVLYHLSNQQCLTFLPLRSLPIPAASRKEITIGFVNNHFVEVFLFPDHPVPPVAGLWTQHRYPCAQGWDTEYNLRIQHFRKLVDFNVSTTDVISID